MGDERRAPGQGSPWGGSASSDYPLPSSPCLKWSNQHLHLHRLLVLGQASSFHGEDTTQQRHRERILQRHLSNQLAVLLGLPQDLREGVGQGEGGCGSRPVHLCTWHTLAQGLLNKGTPISVTPCLCASVSSSGKHKNILPRPASCSCNEAPRVEVQDASLVVGAGMYRSQASGSCSPLPSLPCDPGEVWPSLSLGRFRVLTGAMNRDA